MGRNPTVRLISWTQRPIATVYILWQASRSNDELTSPHLIDDESLEVRDVFRKVIASKIPVAENIHFTFLLEDVSISFREQMVRHRIGVKVGDRIGVDIVPDLADSTWWSQSMRILDMGTFCEEGRYHVPEGLDSEQSAIFLTAMQGAERAYQELIEQGVSMEKAREVIPMATTHRISWTLNLAALQHVVGKRGCWILQGDLWIPILRGMIKELVENVSPLFRELIAPPCTDCGKYRDCLFKLDNERRLASQDEIPPCSLWLRQSGRSPEGGAWNQKRFEEMKKTYGELWARDPETFEKCEKPTGHPGPALI